MLKVLEKRLVKLEKVQRANTDKLSNDQEELMRRETAGKLRRTPESRAALRAYCQRIFRAMHLQKRKRIEVMTSPEQLARLRMQWAKEDAESERLEEKYLKEAKVTPEGLETFLREIVEGPSAKN
jgi:hypothetical protein